VFFTLLQIRVTGLHMEEDFHLCDTTLQKQGKSTKLLCSFVLLLCYAIFQVCHVKMDNTISRKKSCSALLCFGFCLKNVVHACVFQNILFQLMARCRAVQMFFLEGAPKP